MKKSKTITLVLLTSTLFLGCEREVRNQYASWDDCVKDYNDASKCTEEKEKAGTGHRSVYYGPWYRHSLSSSRVVNPSTISNRATGVVRGGWGFSAGHASS
jgi:uncharacterized protein YgiB involved in biofilm formation